jgi:hypothetical protein
MSQRKHAAPKAKSSKAKPVKTKGSPTAARAPHDKPAVLTVLNLHAAGIDV